VSARKRFLTTRFALAGFGVLLRFYRWFAFGGFLLRHDPRLVRVLRSREPAIFVCWHQDFSHSMGYLSRWNVRRPTYVLASASRDGGLAASAAEGVGFREAVRGSTAARGGASALLRLRRLGAGGGVSLAVVGDGPRPPARVLKPGAVHLAATTGLPVWLVRTSWWPDASLPRTWARFHWPLPWHRGVVLAEGPIRVPPPEDRDSLEAARLDLERRLNALADRADAWAERAARGR
jgi:lysophospholipid acyltransferase (LPLAT)-like uncharacterized protein